MHLFVGLCARILQLRCLAGILEDGFDVEEFKGMVYKAREVKIIPQDGVRIPIQKQSGPTICCFCFLAGIGCR